MKGLLPLFLGIFGTFAFSWVGLTFIPNYQIGHLDPQTDEEGADAYPVPKSGMVERGRKVYVANGCAYCHSQQVRADYAASDIERKWGDRRSAPRDYIFDRPVLLSVARMGPDLANVGKRPPNADELFPSGLPAPSAAPAPAASPATATAPPAAAGTAVTPSPPAAPVAAASPAAPAPSGTSPAPAATSPAPATAASPAPEEKLLADDGSPLPYTALWHHRHLYSPRSVAADSNMPAFRFLYEKRRIIGQAASEAVNFIGDDRDKPEAGWEIVPTYEARCLVAYLMSLDQSHPLKEVKSVAAAPAAAPGKAAK